MKKIITPKGEFDSRRKAAKVHGVTDATIGRWIKTNPEEFYEVIEETQEEDFDASVVTTLKVKGKEYKITDLLNSRSSVVNYTLIGKKFIQRATYNKSEDVHLRIAMSSIDDLQKMFPSMQRRQLFSKKKYSESKVVDNPVYQNFLQGRHCNLPK